MRAILACVGAALLMATGAARAAPPEEETVHVVQSGETLNGIANRAKVSREAIIKANNLKEPYGVRVGQKLAIPRAVKPAGKPRPAPLPKPPAVTTKSTGKSTTGAATSAEQETQHVVAPGETLGGIASRAKVPRVLIAEANGLAPPYDVKVGQKLVIPRTRHHTVKAGDTGFDVSYQYGVPWRDIAVANGLDPDAPLPAGKDLLIPTVLNPPPIPTVAATPAPAPAPAPTPAARPAPAAVRFAWPVSGPVRRGWKSHATTDFHDGLDITAPRGATVRAAAAGTVLYAAREKEQFGNLVVLDHGDGWYTAYAFLSRITVKKGVKVVRGERIGLVGDTGMARGNELHFEVRRNGSPVDPLPELPEPPRTP
ncbi:LysM peptidoglycan-binding domain-containing M23 family metallopeptidase [Novosphingobium album (ex Liu et al. 2023)]|uniref:LysM peptidoglycan-binding domain-containing M23 family metallopeptidase n=1 Tax=Novosphingobium album (ex Liu et al. 2023) TaxID=3031130 RepID=A0ABT5WRM4_9SPHN|nr:LysM peptidoglycan-binding domain-containing M23 family metallopeptidase [Novosphingobium album (ex Liu et al. 2023)]MDE8652688.1 LysM peptidoglycan-binding domain-containing M23 family metallopeptidase [Novosphingobium album (ex Liu et al. 2023)]